MKFLLFLFFFFFSTFAFANKYYFSSVNGNASDSYTTSSQASPWATAAKLETLLTSSNTTSDTIYIERSSSFFVSDGININRSNLKILPFGEGARPIIHSLVNLTSWTTVSGKPNVWVTTSALSGNPDWLRLVTKNGVPVAMGRWPDIDSANAGYREYFNPTGSTSSRIVQDPDLNIAARPQDLLTAQIVIRTNDTNIDTGRISSITTAGAITFTGGDKAPTNADKDAQGNFTSNGWGYFFRAALSTLTKQDEWYYDRSTDKLYYYSTFNPVAANIQFSAADVLLKFTAAKNIYIEGIEFWGAHSNVSQAFGTTNNVYLNNCGFYNAGRNGVLLIDEATRNFRVENSNIRNCWNNGLTSYYQNIDSVIIRYCTIENIGTAPGMGVNNNSNYCGISFRGGDYIKAPSNGAGMPHLNLSHNYLDSIGQHGIAFVADGTSRIDSNTINYYSMWLTDAGGIYTSPPNFDSVFDYGGTRSVSYNFISNAANTGRLGTKNPDDTWGKVNAIYLDGGSNQLDLIGNVMENFALTGIYCNECFDTRIMNNVAVGNGYAVRFEEHNTKVPRQRKDFFHLYELDNITFKNNTLISKQSATTGSFIYMPYLYSQTRTVDSIKGRMDAGAANWDNNKYYWLASPTGFSTANSNTTTTAYYNTITLPLSQDATPTQTSKKVSLATWRSTWGVDANSSLGTVAVTNPGTDFKLISNPTDQPITVNLGNRVWQRTSGEAAANNLVYNTNEVVVLPYQSASLVAIPGTVITGGTSNPIRIKRNRFKVLNIIP